MAVKRETYWVRDVILGEDASQVRCGAIPIVMTALRNTTPSALRLQDMRKPSPKLCNISPKILIGDMAYPLRTNIGDGWIVTCPPVTFAVDFLLKEKKRRLLDLLVTIDAVRLQVMHLSRWI